jgi:hypothetical protein
VLDTFGGENFTGDVAVLFELVLDLGYATGGKLKHFGDVGLFDAVGETLEDADLVSALERSPGPSEATRGIGLGFEFEGLGLRSISDLAKFKYEVAAALRNIVRRWLKDQGIVDVVFTGGGATLATLLVEVVDEDG